MAELTGRSMEQIVNWFMLLIIFVFDPLAIAMVVAANMAFAHIKGIARDPKDYEVYKEKIITKEVPVEVEKIVEKIIEKEIPAKVDKIPKHLKGEILRALEHARRKGKDIPVDFEHRFFK